MGEIAVHLGAHKTGTTWLQRRLRDGAGALAAAGIDYEPLARLRPAFTDGFERWVRARPGAPSPAVLRATLSALAARSPHRLLLSDENLMGDCFTFLRTGRLYPGFARRMDRLQEVLPQRPVRVVLTIRDYAGFFPSAYIEALRYRAFEPFDALRGRLTLDDGLWTRIVAALVARFGTDAVRIMRFEKLGPRLPAMLEALFGTPFDPAHLPEVADRHEGLSAAAIQALAQAAAQGDTRPAHVRTTEAAQRHPRGPDSPPFRPWTAQEASALQALYAGHLREIDRRWPGVLI
jgi:hypothetical protein